MSDLNSWEDDPAAQDENLSRQTQQMNLNNQQPQGQGSFRPAASSFQPGVQAFQPGGQNFGAYPQYQQQQQQQQYYAGGQGYYPQYGGQGFDPNAQNYGAVYGQQAAYNQGYGMYLSIVEMRCLPKTDHAKASSIPNITSSSPDKQTRGRCHFNSHSSNNRSPRRL
jgi:hypothetical protein